MNAEGNIQDIQLYTIDEALALKRSYYFALVCSQIPDISCREKYIKKIINSSRNKLKLKIFFQTQYK